MEYMESKMQDLMEAGQQEMEALLDEHNPPHDWSSPEWDKENRVHNWRNYVSREIQEMWFEFTGRQRIIISSNFEEIAGREEWD